MAAKQLMLPANRAFNSNGLAISGAQAKLYLSGGLTPANFFADSGLVTSLGSTLTANGAGRFPTAYGDSTVGYRLRTLDSDGAVLDDIDPYFFGLTTGVDGANASIAVGTTTTGAAGSNAAVSNSGTGTNAILNFTVPRGTDGTDGATGPAGDVAKAADRTALAAIVGQTSGATRFLVESGREGSFVWSSVNNSANVTADTQQGIFVAPASDPTGASGAWVRKFSGAADFRWFGAIADCAAAGSGTSNTAAFDAARAALVAARRGWLHIPQQAAAYRFATAPAEIHDKIMITGEGWSANPGTVGVTTYVGIQVYNGTVLSFDSDVPGFRFIDFTDNLANATVDEFQSAAGSIVKDIMLYSPGGTGTTSNGIERRTTVNLENVRIEGFAGYGLKTIAWTSGSNLYGLADGAYTRSVSCRFNKLSGFYTEGNDSNVIKFDTCDSGINGGVSFLDKSLLGNAYTDCRAATSNQSFGTPAGYSAAQRTQNTTDWSGLSDQTAGSYVTTSAVAAHTFIGCYSESGQGNKHEIVSPSVIVGGNLAATAMTAAAAITPPGRWNASALSGISSINSDGFGSLTVGNTVVDTASGNATLTVKGSGTFSLLHLFPGNSSANGLEISSGNGLAQYSSGAHYFQNAAQTQMLFQHDGNNFNVVHGGIQVGGTTVISSGGALQATAFPALTGDVTTPSGSLATTIGANKVTRGMLAATAGAAVLGATAAGNVTDLTTLPAAVMPAHTGDVTSSAGAVALTVAANAVTFAKMQALSAGGKLLGSAVGSTAVAEITVGTGLTVGTSTLRFANISATTLLGNSTGGATAPGEITLAGGIIFSGTTLTVGALTPTSLASTGAVTSSSATAGIGYATGAGGAVTQLTSRTTGVTLNKICGAITLVSAAGSATWNTFTVTNSAVAATDTVEICQKSGANLYNVIVTAIGAGTFNVSVSAVSGTATESPVFNFVIVKAVAA